MKVEQCIGRIDRIGQQHRDISVLNLCYADSAEDIVTPTFRTYDLTLGIFSVFHFDQI